MPVIWASYLVNQDPLALPWPTRNKTKPPLQDGGEEKAIPGSHGVAQERAGGEEQCKSRNLQTASLTLVPTSVDTWVGSYWYLGLDAHGESWYQCLSSDACWVQLVAKVMHAGKADTSGGIKQVSGG